MFGNSRREAAARRAYAPVFAALGDETRLSLIATLGDGRRRSITGLTKGAKVTRQAITKHLRVLEQAGMVRRIREGRESLYELEPQPIADLKSYLDRVSEEWDATLARLKAFVET
ncbi:MAG TPA: metalloregulator ArsR/SmtB family transcription factor [Stellaceae bacterium]|nr:metalloregulator ArsR/SmtB family transcription factor [Stellaceae bacterium]